MQNTSTSQTPLDELYDNVDHTALTASRRTSDLYLQPADAKLATSSVATSEELYAVLTDPTDKQPPDIYLQPCDVIESQVRKGVSSSVN